ncbi:S8 family peptidase (plasmid) [Asticcacaulis sp. DW145]|uniref:S8 family peptidase n=1 Tax=Asticcacaulis sp. DW145 TaxID=3095608 RepID=UPI003090956D|nr:S8 family peptidase [Asticcacaulis sp. DW145]
MEGRPGVYLDIQGRAGEELVKASLDKSGLKLLTYREADPLHEQEAQAAVFATPKGLENLKKKITDFESKDRSKTKEDGTTTTKPANAALVQSIGSIVEAGLRVLWRSPQAIFPDENGIKAWEIWLDRETAENFIARAPAAGITISTDRLTFPEDTVILAHASRDVLAAAIKISSEVKALAAPVITAAFFDEMPAQDQHDWSADLLRLATFNRAPDAGRLTLLDTGVSLAHPLIAPALPSAHRHSADPAWSLEDNQGHGTQMAGLCLYGDLTFRLQAVQPFTINYQLESIKIIPDAGHNPHHLLGTVTSNAIDFAEATGARRRTYVMASTTKDDTPHDGAPTSWSSALDQLTSGVLGQMPVQRLMIVSAGNSDQRQFSRAPYLRTCDHEDNEIESPAHAWNVIAVGAYTTKTVVPNKSALAPAGDLSPSSRTASWSSHWPIKPDVVMEGGNWVIMNPPPHLQHEDLSLLTTSRGYPQTVFSLSHDTSAATALAGKAITELWADYPSLWPETIRALFVSSARWTPQMRSHLSQNPQKGSYNLLFQRYGYGVPDLDRARRSASNALTLIIQDQITPYKQGGPKSANHAHNEMRAITLPWPTQALRRLGLHPVKLRVALSTFVIPNPSEAARGTKYGYASHNLRFRLRRPGEKDAAFFARVSREALADEEFPVANDDSDNWTFGSKRRDVGSLHVDELEIPASDLARRDLLVVHPVTGWWKFKSTPFPETKTARFALIVEIDAGDVDIDLYTEIAQAIATRNLTVVTA